MVVFVFEIVLTCDTKAMRDNIKEFIENADKDYVHKMVTIGDVGLRFRGRIPTVQKAKQIRDWLKNKLDGMDKTKIFAQIWYDKLVTKTRTIEIPNPENPEQTIMVDRDCEEPASQGKEISIGTLGVGGV